MALTTEAIQYLSKIVNIGIKESGSMDNYIEDCVRNDFDSCLIFLYRYWSLTEAQREKIQRLITATKLSGVGYILPDLVSKT